ncbi:hypothetical protein MTO96_044339 [Rhipicephalus appendiculatus]
MPGTLVKSLLWRQLGLTTSCSFREIKPRLAIDLAAQSGLMPTTRNRESLRTVSLKAARSHEYLDESGSATGALPRCNDASKIRDA